MREHEFTVDLPHSAHRLWALFQRYERKVNRLMDMYLRFVTAWERGQWSALDGDPIVKEELQAQYNAALAWAMKVEGTALGADA